MRFFASISGLTRLASQYAASQPPEGQQLTKQTVQVGAVRFRRCVTVHVGSPGLHLLVHPIMSRYPPILIPWEEIRGAQPALIYWQSAKRMAVGKPSVATITVKTSLFRILEPYLQTPVSERS